jgi:hypothetical protein
MDTPPPDQKIASDMPREKGVRVQGKGYRGRNSPGAGCFCSLTGFPGSSGLSGNDASERRNADRRPGPFIRRRSFFRKLKLLVKNMTPEATSRKAIKIPLFPPFTKGDEGGFDGTDGID